MDTAARAKLNATTRILRPVSTFIRDNAAQTVYVQWIPGVAVSNGAALTVSVEGVNISGVTAPDGLAAGDTKGLILPIAINAANSATIARSSDAIAGHVEIQVTHSGVIDTCWMSVEDAPATGGGGGGLTLTRIGTTSTLNGSRTEATFDLTASNAIVTAWEDETYPAMVLDIAEGNDRRQHTIYRLSDLPTRAGQLLSFEYGDDTVTISTAGYRNQFGEWVSGGNQVLVTNSSAFARGAAFAMHGVS